MSTGRTLDDLSNEVIENILREAKRAGLLNPLLQTSKRFLELAHRYLLRYVSGTLNSLLDRHDFLPILQGPKRITGEDLLGSENLDGNIIKILIRFEELVNYQIYSRDNKEELIEFLASREAQEVNSIYFWQSAMCLFFIVCGQLVRNESERKICFITSENLYITKNFFRELVKINPATRLPYYRALFEDTSWVFDNMELMKLSDAAKSLLAHLKQSGLPSLSSQLERWLDATLFRGSHSSRAVKSFSSSIKESALEEMKLDFSAPSPVESQYKKNLIRDARFEYDPVNMMAICKAIASMPLNDLISIDNYVPNTTKFLMVLNPPLFFYHSELLDYCDRSLQAAQDMDSHNKYHTLKKIINGARGMIFENNVFFHEDDIKIKISSNGFSILDITYRLMLSYPGLNNDFYSYVLVYLSFNMGFKDAKEVAARFLKTMKELEGKARGLDWFIEQNDSFHFGRCVSDIVEYLPRLYNLSPQFLDLYLLFLQRQTNTRTMALDKSSRFFFLLFKDWVDSDHQHLARKHIDDDSLFHTAENRKRIVIITEIIAKLCSKHLSAPPFSFAEIMSPRSFLWKIPLEDILKWLSTWISKDTSKNKEMLLLYLVSRNESRLDWSFLGSNFLQLSLCFRTDKQAAFPQSIPFLHILPLLPDKLLKEVIAKVKENIQGKKPPIADLSQVLGFEAYQKIMREYIGVFEMSSINKLKRCALFFANVPGIVFEELYRPYFIFDFSGLSSNGSGLTVKSISRNKLSDEGIGLSDLVLAIIKADEHVELARTKKLVELIIQHRKDPDFIEFIRQANDLEPASLIKKVDQYFYKRFSPKTANSEAAAAVSHTSEKPAEEVVSQFKFPFMSFAPNATKPNPAPSNTTPPEGAAVTQFEFPPLPSLPDFVSSAPANEQLSSSPVPAWMTFGKQ